MLHYCQPFSKTLNRILGFSILPKSPNLSKSYVQLHVGHVEGPYHRFCMFEPNIFNFHTCYVTNNHFPKDKTVFQLS
ncbi:hypothetical protein LDENG_00297910 [Lucifuga dentata]|nr:hypothetical protein LDENG_00297910 [Lucifuga dentata]